MVVTGDLISVAICMFYCLITLTLQQSTLSAAAYFAFCECLRPAGKTEVTPQERGEERINLTQTCSQFELSSPARRVILTGDTQRDRERGRERGKDAGTSRGSQ